MIAEILSRRFLEAWLPPVEQALRDLADESGDPSGEYADALAGLAEVRDSGLQGQPNDGAVSVRRGWDDDSALDEYSFFSRHPVMSLLQSAIEERIETAYPDLILDDRQGARRAADDVPVLCDLRLDFGEAIDSGRRLFGRFEVTDFRWIADIGVAKALRAFRHRHPFNPEPAPPVTLADDARIVMVGDWGSGLPRARTVAQHMRTAINEGLEQGRQVHVIHLGDVYYSGFPREYRDRFLRYWPVRADEANRVYSWCVNGNHDMYSGGYGYFQTLLADPRFAHHAGSSWFLIENEHWRIVGLDTAWDEEALVHDSRTERGLADPQAATLKKWAEADARPFMLLSHHQLFSAHERVGPILQEKLRSLLESGRIRSWFWGHEHKCVVYGPHLGVTYGRCVGHGGVPVYSVGEPPSDDPPVQWYEARAVGAGLERWAPFGFAVLDFHGSDVGVKYVDEYGEEVYREVLNATD